MKVHLSIVIIMRAEKMKRVFLSLVPRAGIEPAWDYSQRILSPSCIPVPPPRLTPDNSTAFLQIRQGF